MNTLKIDNDILINTCSNFEKESKDIFFTTDINFIQFHFCLEGKISLKYNNGAYTFNLQENNSIILFNPSTNLPIDGSLGEKTKYVSLLITIKKFHSLFSELTDNISFLSQENSGKKYYKDQKNFIQLKSKYINSDGLWENVGLAIKIAIDLGVDIKIIKKTLAKIQFEGRVQFIKGKLTKNLKKIKRSNTPDKRNFKLRKCFKK